MQVLFAAERRTVDYETPGIVEAFSEEELTNAINNIETEKRPDLVDLAKSNVGPVRAVVMIVTTFSLQ